LRLYLLLGALGLVAVLGWSLALAAAVGGGRDLPPLPPAVHLRGHLGCLGCSIPLLAALGVLAAVLAADMTGTGMTPLSGRLRGLAGLRGPALDCPAVRDAMTDKATAGQDRRHGCGRGAPGAHRAVKKG
jgi:hypothetical protein